MECKHSSHASSESVKEEAGDITVTWESASDPTNPLNWPRGRKWLLSGIGYGFLTLVGGSVSAYSTSQPSLERALHISDFVGTLGIVVFTVTYGAAPLMLAPFSEVFGRSPVYLGSALLFWLMFIPQALAKNLETVLITRFISGIGGSTAVALVGGTLADIWETHERGLPMALFSFVAFAGTGLGPVTFGYVELTLGYQYINWILFGLSGIFTVALMAVLRETRASVILTRKAAQLRRETGNMRYRAKAEEERASISHLIKNSLSRPIYLFFTEPIVFVFTTWITYAWGILYIQLESIPLIFTELHDFNAGENGLVFLAQILGPVFGFAVNLWCDRLYAKNFTRKGPEGRLYIAMIAGLALPIGCWLYTWTNWEQVHWIVPIIGITVIYASMFGIYLACFNYLADSYTIYASSALSAQSCVRLVVGALFSLAAQPMYRGLGVHGAGSLLATLATLFTVTPFVMYRYGSRIRAQSSFAKHLASLE
ncbi:major facilitator superfamily domain-containing protein [Hygrophoropsis aurantiaca]|uniref:Major facilitator superfamily domain-containing protein n=1 Tax=Hygrophoropsis aurantiaca TaxID=72124 RepID=A0ACB7ZRX1_9AGAM|nr:major facilitator superfamily domain-containing protein [Hygrophoropsis aurantiaca]